MLLLFLLASTWVRGRQTTRLRLRLQLLDLLMRSQTDLFEGWCILLQTGHVDGSATAILIRLDGHEAYSRRVPRRCRMLLIVRCGSGRRRRYRRHRRADRRQEGYSLPIASTAGSHAAILRRGHYSDTANPTNLRQRTVAHVDGEPLVHLKGKHQNQKSTLHAPSLSSSIFLFCLLSPFISRFTHSLLEVQFISHTSLTFSPRKLFQENR